MAKKIEVWLYANIGFAQMNEGGDEKD